MDPIHIQLHRWKSLSHADIWLSRWSYQLQCIGCCLRSGPDESVSGIVTESEFRKFVDDSSWMESVVSIFLYGDRRSGSSEWYCMSKWVRKSLLPKSLQRRWSRFPWSNIFGYHQSNISNFILALSIGRISEDDFRYLLTVDDQTVRLFARLFRERSNSIKRTFNRNCLLSSVVSADLIGLLHRMRENEKAKEDRQMIISMDPFCKSSSSAVTRLMKNDLHHSMHRSNKLEGNFR